MKTAITPHLSLVGAGPGDPDLLTLKAVKTLRAAKVILYDALANEQLLQYAAPDAITTFVGKRFGCHALSQQAINQLIIESALTYGHVVRLKGGDPFVFGRAQEEIDCARSHNIPVTVVPGITSAIAVAASQMIPVTCRGLAESFWVTTGTTRTGHLSADVQLAAQSSATVVLLMAMSKLEQIMDLFAANGKASTPVAIIQDGTTERERMVTGTVKDIVFKAEYGGFTNPAIIIVGEVVHLAAGSLPAQVNSVITSYTAVNKAS
ncbi:uroporphyrin-III C-methyltransferase [Filimonas zeae]|uniref:uroporphyrinogen-III C-methyltransferase n=1 Tax=Filimonas zeae TaxID=1737353 RepID=A0A917IUJ1_9BACT|nr:uroporphyrinogen-III C-methyltransferase [Filimonas zeae]MDR6339151.1 uroporphyrin-III C-methyltransferase [Filimonas zeae]GGH64874.1 uroporphyrinogen-III C-methyltransferase [Filimonas zeae]